MGGSGVPTLQGMTDTVPMASGGSVVLASLPLMCILILVVCLKKKRKLERAQATRQELSLFG